jgi:hypothetical protein
MADEGDPWGSGKESEWKKDSAWDIKDRDWEKEDVEVTKPIRKKILDLQRLVHSTSTALKEVAGEIVGSRNKTDVSNNNGVYQSAKFAQKFMVANRMHF